MRKTIPLCTLCAAGALLLASCSVDRLAVRAVADALTADGGSEVFTGDEDPELVGDALPFAIKLYESLLSKEPEHEGLIVSTGSLFVMYANAFVQETADALPAERYEERAAGIERAKRLYLRGYGILRSGLELRHPGYAESAAAGTLGNLLEAGEADEVPLLYWTAAAAMGAFSLSPFDVGLSVRVPEARALMARAYELDPDFGGASIDEFYISFYGSLPEGLGGGRQAARTHFERAVAKTGGRSAGPYVAYAQAVSVPEQDYPEFKELLARALAVDPDADAANRLVNIIAQRRARRLLATAADFFLDAEEPTPPEEGAVAR